jgi:hypothetical protein
MKRSFIRAAAFVLSLCAAIVLTGCESAINPTADALNTGRAAAVPVTISGPLAVLEGEYAVLYQGNPWYIKGPAKANIAEGSSLRVAGGALPILDRDEEGNSLFYGYYLHVF